MKIAVFFGGLSSERDVSIRGGQSVIEALKSLGHEVIPVDPALGEDFNRSADELINESVRPDSEELANLSPRNYILAVNSSKLDDIDLAFLVLHGKYGEDGKIQALLELRGIPYTGSGVMASSVAMDKSATKLIFHSHNILTPDGLLISDDHEDEYSFMKEIREHLGSKLVFKPNEEGSTFGLTIIKDGNIDDMIQAAKLAGKFSKGVLVEQYISGRELTVGIVGDTVLPVIEIIPDGGFYDYEHKYTKGKTEYVCPADLSDDITDFVQSMADIAFKSLGCRGFARVDFRLNEDGQPFCLEVNTIPGFTNLSLVPMAAKEIGIEFPELCKMLIDEAITHFNLINNKK